MPPTGHAHAENSNTGDCRDNLETQLDNLAEFDPRDKFSYEYVASVRAIS